MSAVPLHTLPPKHCRANMAHMRQSRPDYGLDFQGKPFKAFQVVPPSLGAALNAKSGVGAGGDDRSLSPVKILSQSNP